MANMYLVRVDAVEGNRLTCHVTVDYPDEPLIASRTLAFRFIWEPWDDLNQGSVPLGSHGFGSIQARMKARRAPLAKALGGRDLSADLDWCCLNADRFIGCVGVTDPRFGDDERGWDERPLEERPQATFTITATDPRWLKHLAPGMAWGTAGFNDDIGIRVDASWRTPTVNQIAQGIKKTGDFSATPILADALQDAGCDSELLLDHFRDLKRTHVRGCWALEYVLGQE